MSSIMELRLGYIPGMALDASLRAFGDKVSNLAAAETLALLVKRPFAVFMIDCNFDFEALRSR